MIKETIINNIETDTIHNLLIKYDLLKDFKLAYKKVKDYGIVRKFSIKDKSYLINLFIVKNNKNLWIAKLVVYWKIKSKEETSARGKDFEIDFGPFKEVHELLDTLNSKFKNNPILGNKSIYSDNPSDNDNKIIIKLIIDLIKDEEKIDYLMNNENIDSFFEDLKKTYIKISSFKNKEELYEFLKNDFVDWLDRQRFILTLQKQDKIKYFKDIQNSTDRNIF